MKPPKRCRICESTDGPPWTEEDAYPKWFRKRTREWLKSIPANFFPDGPDLGARTLLKPVCEKCQRRLNVLFEDRAHKLLKAMLDGLILTITPRQQEILGGWFVKTAIILAMCRPTTNADEMAELQAHLRVMLKEGTPPAGSTTRVGFFVYDHGETEGGFLPPGWPGRDRREFLSLLIGPGLVSETLIVDRPHLVPFIEATQNDDRFLRVWPRQLTDAIWPPPLFLCPADAIALTEEWHKFTPPVLGGNFPWMYMPAPRDEPDDEPPDDLSPQGIVPP